MHGWIGNGCNILVREPDSKRLLGRLNNRSENNILKWSYSNGLTFFESVIFSRDFLSELGTGSRSILIFVVIS